MKLKHLTLATLLLASCVTTKDAADSAVNNSTATADNNTTAKVEVMSKEAERNSIAKERNEEGVQSNSFAFSLFKHILCNETEENICLSPASAECAIAMAANGAKGQTLKQILSALNCTEDPDALNHKEYYTLSDEESTTTLLSANSIWINENLPVKAQFIADNIMYHNAQVANVPFNSSTTSAINDWCSQKTNGKITKIIDRLNENDKMILINALYLKGRWEDKFSKGATTDAPFTKSDGTVTTVKMMHQTLTTSYNLDDNLRMVSMPMKNSHIRALFILPRQGMSMSEAAAHLASSYDTLCKGMYPRQRIKLSLPRFKTEYSTSLRNSLEALGMSDAFGRNANFKGISKKPLYINDILQKTYLSIDEEGAEAAAVTSIMVGCLAARPTTEPIEVKFDRPFFYTITDTRTNNILFIGKVGNPTE